MTTGAAGPTAGVAASPEYSRAFGAFVTGPEDLTGLIAYALYKQVIREKAATGILTPREHRHPTQTELTNYRNAANGHLQTFAAEVTRAATPQIVAEGVSVAVETAKADIVEAINQRTSFWLAMGTNLAAWVVTLAVTILIIVGIYLPNWQADIIARVQALHLDQPAPTTTQPVHP
jgi:hypothetical protein